MANLQQDPPSVYEPTPSSTEVQRPPEPYHVVLEVCQNGNGLDEPAITRIQVAGIFKDFSTAKDFAILYASNTIYGQVRAVDDTASFHSEISSESTKCAVAWKNHSTTVIVKKGEMKEGIGGFTTEPLGFAGGLQRSWNRVS